MIESDVRGFKLSRARTSAYWDRLHYVMLASFFGRQKFLLEENLEAHAQIGNDNNSESPAAIGEAQWRSRLATSLHALPGRFSTKSAHSTACRRALPARPLTGLLPQTCLADNLLHDCSRRGGEMTRACPPTPLCGLHRTVAAVQLYGRRQGPVVLWRSSQAPASSGSPLRNRFTARDGRPPQRGARSRRPAHFRLCRHDDGHTGAQQLHERHRAKRPVTIAGRSDGRSTQGVRT